MRNRTKVPMIGVTIDISDCMLNKMLLRNDYEAPTALPELELHMLKSLRERAWLARILIDDGNPLGMQNKDRIAKSSLSFRAKFW